MHSGVKQSHQQLHQRRTAAAEAPGQHIGAQQQHGAGFSLRERLPHPAGVAMHQVGLQLRQLFRRNAHIRQLAEAGVHPINRLPGGQNLLNQGAAVGHAGQGCGRNSHPAAGQRDGFNFGQRQRLSVKNQSIHEPMISG